MTHTHTHTHTHSQPFRLSVTRRSAWGTNSESAFCEDNKSFWEEVNPSAFLNENVVPVTAAEPPAAAQRRSDCDIPALYAAGNEVPREMKVL